MRRVAGTCLDVSNGASRLGGGVLVGESLCIGFRSPLLSAGERIY